jgi:Abnormal spindle-like microcephaly-assoc'd, ASPM-SPD-2-Hydin
MGSVFGRAAVAAGVVAVVLGSAAGTAAARPRPPVLAFHPAPFDYGRVTVRQQRVETFTLANTGGRASSALTVSLSGSAAFSITADACTATSLGPGKTCTVTVRFAPTAIGTFTATLQAAGKNRAAAASDALTGTGKGFGATLGHIYWSNDVSTNGAIKAVPLTPGGTATIVVNNQINPAGVAVDASRVYWATENSSCCPGAIKAAPLAGGTPAILANKQDNPVGVAVDSSHIYWANQATSTIREAPLTGGTATFLNKAGSTGAKPAGVAVDGSHIYWANFAAGTINAAPLTPGAPVATLVGAQVQPFGVAVDASHIYWANQGGGGITSGTIMEANLDGTGVTPLVTGQNKPAGVAVDSSHIYWANSGNGTINAAPLTPGATPTVLVTGQLLPTGVAVGP